MSKVQGQPETSGAMKYLQSSVESMAFQKECWDTGKARKAEGKPIVWSGSVIPKEIYHSMGVWPYYPEQFAALFGARRLGGSKDPDVETYAVKYCRIAEAEGFSNYLCGYARTVMGYVIHGLRTGQWDNAPRGGVPLPDVLVIESTPCDIRMKWWEYMAQMLKVPLFTLDAPELAHDCIGCVPGIRYPILTPRSGIKRGVTDFVSYAPADHDMNYLISQFQDCIAFLERYTGLQHDEDKLNEAMNWSYRTNEVIQEIVQLRKTVPAPMSSVDGIASIFPMHYFMGLKKTYDFFVNQRDELRERVKAGISVVPEEKFRLMWFGLPLWFNMGIFSYFEKWGGVFTWEPAYYPTPYPPRTPKDPIRELARRCFQMCYGVGSAQSGVVQDCREHSISGLVMSYLITCRPIVLSTTEVGNAVQQEMGIPVMSIESDLVDERIYAASQVEKNLDTFAEILLSRVGIKK